MDTKKFKQTAFTLAEVLITLGIIGVVAAVTMPTLVKNYQEKAWNTSSQVFLSKFTNALKVMNTQGVLGGLGTTENFVAELGKHMKIMKTCDNNDLNSCMSLKLATMIDYDQGGIAVPVDANTSIKTAQNLGLDWGTNVVGFVLANGQSALVAYNPNCVEDTYNNQFVATSCVAGIYDVNGLSNPNSTNKDIRTYGSVSINSSAAIKFNGKLWKAPVLASSLYNDYLRGAADTCGGMQNLPTWTDADKLRQSIYSGRYMDTDKTSIFPYPGYIVIWLNEESNAAEMGCVAEFRSVDYYHLCNYARYNGGYGLAVCNAD